MLSLYVNTIPNLWPGCDVYAFRVIVGVCILHMWETGVGLSLTNSAGILMKLHDSKSETHAVQVSVTLPGRTPVRWTATLAGYLKRDLESGKLGQTRNCTELCVCWITDRRL